MGKGKQEKNDLQLPPAGGEWRFCMASGMVIPGIVVARYDNATVIETPAKETVVIQTRNLESMWEGKGIPEEKKEEEEKR